jgi:phosphoglycerate dehydrogenase-like enzyme
MADERPLVWIPFDVDELGDLPADLRYETVVPSDDDLPDSAVDVQFYVPAYQLVAEQGAVLARMPRLRVVQTLTAGVEHIRSQVP